MPSRIADVDLVRELSVSELSPPPSEAELEKADQDGYLAGNREFGNLSWVGAKQLRDTLAVERAVLERLETASDIDDEADVVRDELYKEWDADGLWGLDPGIASVTIALATLGAVPVASCNGGILGGHHHEEYPLVAFYLPRVLAPTVLELAERSGSGLIVDKGIAQVFGQTYRELMHFAELALEVATGRPHLRN